MSSRSPLHAGEVFIQGTAGAVERVAGFAGLVIGDHMPDQRRLFFGQLPFVVMASVDPEGNPWATLHTGPPGFASSPDPWRLLLGGVLSSDDPVAAGLADGSSVGLLGIELETRRRNRMNGHVLQTPGGLEVTVEHSFGNCPQYIQRRMVEPAVPRPAPPIRSQVLTDGARDFIARSDTLYVGSYVDLDHGRQVDVSHRGGRAGFVHIDAAGVLTVPDFAGNLLFNTLGNFQLNPRGALLFVDFQTGDMLHLTGTVELVLQGPQIAAFRGAERLWRFRTTDLVLRPGALALRARFLDASPNIRHTGTWEQARSRLGSPEVRAPWQSLRVAQIVEESRTIRSLVLEPLGPQRIAHLAGQHIPIRLSVPGHPRPLVRTYSLSSAPGDPQYRISVKAQGVVSRRLHDLRVGDNVQVGDPSGAFVMDATQRRPAVLLGAGVGITPLLSMLRHIVLEGRRTRQLRPTWVFYSARNEAERAFLPELQALVKRSYGAVRLVRVLSEPSGEGSYDVKGRITGDLIQSMLNPIGADAYLCGPPAFMHSVYRDLRSLQVPDARIHLEAFGPDSVRRDTRSNADQASEAPVAVRFAASAVDAEWTPADPNLLEVAEAADLSPAFGCRGGSCGSCAVRLLTGRVFYPSPPSFPVESDQVLLCCAVPADAGSPVSVDL